MRKISAEAVASEAVSAPAEMDEKNELEPTTDLQHSFVADDVEASASIGLPPSDRIDDATSSDESDSPSPSADGNEITAGAAATEAKSTNAPDETESGQLDGTVEEPTVGAHNTSEVSGADDINRSLATNLELSGSAPLIENVQDAGSLHIGWEVTGPTSNPKLPSVKSLVPVPLTQLVLADMTGEELDKITVNCLFVNRAILVPVLKELRRRYLQPGRRAPVPGFPTWTEYVTARIGRSMRAVQYWLEEPGAKTAPGSKGINKKGSKDKPKPQLDPDPAELTKWPTSVRDAQEYCQKLIPILTEEEKTGNPLLLAFANTAPSAPPRDVAQTFFRYMVRACSAEDALSTAEIIVQVANDELDFIREELDRQASSDEPILDELEPLAGEEHSSEVIAEALAEPPAEVVNKATIKDRRNDEKQLPDKKPVKSVPPSSHNASPVQVTEHKKNKAGQEYNCEKCVQKIVAGEMYFEWPYKSILRRQHNSHGFPEPSQFAKATPSVQEVA